MKMVPDRMERMGLTSIEVQNRLDKLSDTQLHQLALKLDELKTGADVGGVIIVVLVILILVWVVFYLFGHRITIEPS